MKSRILLVLLIGAGLAGIAGLLHALPDGEPAKAAVARAAEDEAAKTSDTGSQSEQNAQKTATSESGSKLAPWEAKMPQPDEEQLKSEGVPEKEKQLVYSLSPWTANEKEPYGGTFVPKSEKVFYLLADHDSLVNPVRTEVYYWPITQEYMADWFGYREDVPGKLEILQDGKVIKTLEKVKYAYKYGGDDWTAPPTLLVGEEALREYEAYNKATDEYYKAMTKYYEEYDAWNRYMEKLIKRVQETGKPAKPEEIPEAPKQPEPPKIYVTEPTEAFLVNLPAGEYEIRTVDEKGKVVPGSEKKLVVVAPRRRGIGYVIVPESEWTQPFTSEDTTQLLYTYGSRTLYLGVFDELEYNRYAYTRLTQVHVPLAGKGTETAWQWVQTKELTDVKLQLVKDGNVVQELVRQPFYVKQTPGYALGYEIIPFDENDPAMQGQQPTLWGFKVVVPEGEGYQIRVVDAKGNVLPTSVRDIRSVGRPDPWALYAISLFPLAVGAIVYSLRRSRMRRRVPVGVEL
ncbi:MAG: hypothetical protein IMX00_02165 [Limnochordales bacterium]|nr:hypothetical protein [Limnochordales bacterium]